MKGHLEATSSESKKGKKKEKDSALYPRYIQVNKKLEPLTKRVGYDLKGKVAIITGGNRGIGYATAIELAKKGCNIVIGAKTVVPREKTKETIWMARDWLIDTYGVKVLAMKVDVRMDRDVEELVRVTIEEFGRIDILINNAGALIPQKTEELSMKQYDLMMDISVRGAFHLSKLCIPYLKKSPNPHVIFMVPPVNLGVKVFLQAHLGYTMSKFSVGMMMQGLAAEFEGDIAFNSLWPRTAIDTNAIRNVTRSGSIGMLLRVPEIMGKACVKIFESDYEKYTGNAFIEDEVLIGAGEETMESVNKYNVDPNIPILVPDLLL